jgi:hypothetical protein
MRIMLDTNIRTTWHVNPQMVRETLSLLLRHIPPLESIILGMRVPRPPYDAEVCKCIYLKINGNFIRNCFKQTV